MMTLLTDDGGENGLNFDQFLSLVSPPPPKKPLPDHPCPPSCPPSFPCRRRGAASARRLHRPRGSAPDRV